MRENKDKGEESKRWKLTKIGRNSKKIKGKWTKEEKLDAKVNEKRKKLGNIKMENKEKRKS